MRKAFWDTLHDQGFLDETSKLGLAVAPLSAPDVEKIISDSYAISPQLVTRLRERSTTRNELRKFVARTHHRHGCGLFVRIGRYDRRSSKGSMGSARAGSGTGGHGTRTRRANLVLGHRRRRTSGCACPSQRRERFELAVSAAGFCEGRLSGRRLIRGGTITGRIWPTRKILESRRRTCAVSSIFCVSADCMC